MAQTSPASYPIMTISLMGISSSNNGTNNCNLGGAIDVENGKVVNVSAALCLLELHNKWVQSK